MNAFEFILRNWREVMALTGGHLLLVAVSTLIAVAIGLPLGLLLTRKARLKRPVLAVANILQTVPSLALFGFIIPLKYVRGIGWEAAVAMGMTDRQILRQVELPLAAPVILAGVRVATVISVGVATIAAAIGAGGLGVFIFRGLRQYDNNLILAGAVPAALLALAADAGLGLIESRLDVRRRARRARVNRLVPRVALAVLLPVVVLGGAYA